MVEPANAAWLAKNLGSEIEDGCSSFPRSDHLLALDHDRADVIAAAVAFALFGRTGGG